jgi:GT2 family glycosyltransferase
MAARRVNAPRVVLDGKFFRLGEARFPVKGVTYGPFAPGDDGVPFPAPEQAARDFAGIHDLGANVVRVYEVPPRWLLDLALQYELRLLIDIPWAKHVCFLDSEELKAAARQAVHRAVAACKQHAAVFAFSVVNEIPAEIVRWSGARAVARFLDELVTVAKAADPTCLCTFASFPPTEHLQPQSLDFVCFNVFLHQRPAFEGYLARLQMIADTKPLVISECGVDSLREGESRQAEMLAWQVEAAFRGGAAGLVVFSYTDDWHCGGQQVVDWAFGLTTRRRAQRQSYDVVRKAFEQAPLFPLPRCPKVSVVVACYNGERTLRVCLESLCRLNYPDYEIILVDDGSTDATPKIAQEFARVRYVHQPNHGLSVARNTGIAAATGEVVAFTDADCRADADWLHFLIGDLLATGCVGIGGHNLLPPDDSRVAAAVLVSPGGPTHVMLTDREAEHVPGCNMAFYKWALDEIGGFDPVFRKAGDDVDICWRLQARGHSIGFSPAGLVWHYRRSTVTEYLRQQRGYGEAEAVLARKHPERFNVLGGGLWRGRIYSTAQPGIRLHRSMVYAGRFGSGMFPRLYAPLSAPWLMIATSLEYHVLVTVPLVALALVRPWFWPLAGAALAITLTVAGAAAVQAELPLRQRAWWSRGLVGLLFILQPVARGWARYQERLTAQSLRPITFQRRDLPPPAGWARPAPTLCFWSPGAADRYQFLQRLAAKLQEEGWQWSADAGWEDYDLEISGRRWTRLRVTTVAEELEGGKKVLRCRLRGSWSFLSRLVVGAALGLLLLLGLWLTGRWPWIWLSWLALPLAGALLEREKRVLLRILAALLNEVAQELEWVNLNQAAAPGAPPTVEPPATGEAGKSPRNL